MQNLESVAQKMTELPIAGLPAGQFEKSGDFHENAPQPPHKIENSLKKGHFEKKMEFFWF